EGSLSGVFYAATELEARFCSDEPVVVVGGGNSAGQAALFLAERCATVQLVHRGDDLESSMSQYLISRLRKAMNVEILLESEVTALHGEQRIAEVVVQDSAGSERVLSASALFVMIGADPCSEWLRGAIALDEAG